MSGEGWVFSGSPRDVVAALMQRAWDDDTTDDDRILLETAAETLADSLDRNVRLAQVIEKSGVGL
jgi:alkanesulfonate monooxygenase SsuD/methylene tetrahydromethanopterin reductase-like flavin-dependent oxidoreductase (luciferase family)